MKKLCQFFFQKYDQCNGKIIDRFQNQNQNLWDAKNLDVEEETLVYVYKC